VAARTARAARERRDANRAQEIAAQCSRQLDEMLGGGEPGALAPGRGTASPPPPDNAGLVPLDQVRSERTAKLREEKADAERQVKEATEQAQTAEREVRRLVRQLVPHDWLWTSLPGSDDADLDWAKLSDFNARQEIRWTRELDDLNVQALLAYGDSVRVRPDGQERAAQLFRHLRHLYLPSDFRLLTALRECVRGEARGEYDAAIGVLIELSHIKDPVHFDTLQWFTDRWCNVERRLDVFAGASARAGPAGELQAWLADQLCTITERTDLASSVHRRAHKHALEAVGAACSGAPPSVLWRMGLLAARLGRLDLSRVAYERAMEVDAGPAGVRGDVAARRDGARAARTASEYASSFAQFLEVVRRPEGPSRTRAEYTVMRVATRLLQQQFDEALAELGALSSSVCEADSGWRTRLVEPLGKLLEAAGRAGASVAVLDHTYYTLKDWLSIQPAQLAVSPEVQSDGLRSGLRLTGERHGGLRGRAAAAVPQARAGAFYPMVTPVALEVAAVLAAAIGLREGSVAFTTYLPQMRERILQDTGIRVPGVRIRENASDLGANQYLIMINEIPLELGHVPGHSVFVPEAKSGPARTQARIGRRCTTKAPAGEWVRTDPPGAGMPPAGHWAPLSYVVAHLEGVLRRFLAEFLSLDEAAGMFEGWRTRRLTPPQAQFALELTSDHRMVVEAVRVLRALLEEGVPLVAPGAALDGLRSALATSSLIDAIERMRGSVREWLPGNEIAWRHLRLAPDVEKVLLDGLAGTGTAPGLTLSPEDLQEVLSAIRTEGLPDYDAAIVVGPAQLRPYVLRILEEEWPQVPVLTRDELTPSLQVRFSEFPAITLA
jgi:hypothetical protein